MTICLPLNIHMERAPLSMATHTQKSYCWASQPFDMTWIILAVVLTLMNVHFFLELPSSSNLLSPLDTKRLTSFPWKA